MQNRYVGDIGDFANNGLLRWLCGVTGNPQTNHWLRLGVVEYLNEPAGAEAKNRDGSRIQYLCTSPICGPDNKRDYHGCDVSLYDSLKGIVEEGKRNVLEVRNRGILPGASYYCSPISRRVDRAQWLADALAKVNEVKANIVFLNPDKGIAPEYDGNSTAHVYMRDLEGFVQDGKSLVIYHHFDHSTKDDTAKKQICRLAEGLHCKFNRHIRVLRWRRIQTRFYFIVAQKGHQPVIDKRLESFKESQWGIDRKPRFRTPHFTIERCFALGDSCRL